MKNTNNSKSNAIATVNTSKNAIATVNAKTTDNNAKTNTLLTTDKLTELFIKNNVLPRFVCNGFYVGCGIGRTNIFSVNTRTKWSQYSVYVSNDVYSSLLKHKTDLKNCEFKLLDNKTDKTRPNTIYCKSVDDIEKLLKFLVIDFKSVMLTQ